MATHTASEAARAMARARWDKTTPEQRIQVAQQLAAKSHAPAAERKRSKTRRKTAR